MAHKLNMETIVEKQREFFRSGRTIPVSFRLEMLKKLHRTIRNREDEIAAALEKDLGKCAFEGYMCETGLVLSELSYMMRHLRGFARKRRVYTPMPLFPASGYSIPTPRGNVLIMSPWNYPFLLTMSPLVNALAAGNTAVVKPSAYAPATSSVIADMLTQCFPSEYVAAVTGGREENAALLQQKYDLIFFTGSHTVGQEVLRCASQRCTPTILELGGKSPCIVDSTAKLSLTARRIVFGKFLNCGQTCVAPDYILCQREIKDALVEELKKEIRRQYGENPLSEPNYGKIVNRRHFDRLRGLMDSGVCVFGGECREETLQIAPTILDRVNREDAVMEQEIFGPILPILTFDRVEEIPELMADRPKPLAMYLFSQNRGHIKTITEGCTYGGGCINDTIVHLATPHLGFGGVGESGMGAYHGKIGFDTFSHLKSIVDRKTWMDLPMRCRPYRKIYGKLLRLFLR